MNETVPKIRPKSGKNDCGTVSNQLFWHLRVFVPMFCCDTLRLEMAAATCPFNITYVKIVLKSHATQNAIVFFQIIDPIRYWMCVLAFLFIYMEYQPNNLHVLFVFIKLYSKNILSLTQKIFKAFLKKYRKF